jgi:hypothetical protein
MNKSIIYSILQYKHSLALGEILNVGILFYFPEEKQFEFALGDASRLKAIYPNFSSSLFNAYIKNIKINIKNAIDLFSGYPLSDDFIQFIHSRILPADAAGLVFSEPNQAINVFKDRNTAVTEFSKLLLPGIDIEKPEKIRHSEEYLERKFRGYLLDANVEKHLKKDEILNTKHFIYKFDYSWKSKEGKNFIKPLSFDLQEESAIQNKAATYYGFITDLNDYFKEDQSQRFDLLIAKPQNKDLTRSFENALDFIYSAKGNKNLILEDEIESYTNEIISQLIINN